MLLASATVSLDGYTTGPEVSHKHPMGVGGARLHRWIMDPTPADQEVLDEMSDAVGAVVLGRRTFDVGRAHWNDDTPYPCPSFVVTHRAHDEIPTRSAAFVFLPELGTAVERARAAAGEKHVVLMGADVTQQALDAGLVDELRLQVAPVVLGSGTRLFTGSRQHDFQCVDARVTQHVTHLLFRSAPRLDPLPG